IDAVILNVPVFSFPSFSLIAAKLQNIPLIALSPVNGKMPGLGGLQATVNAIREAGLKCEKVWGNIDENDTLKKVMGFLRAAHAVTELKGQVFGLIGGRSIGMASGAVNPDVWMKVFGVDVDHIDQSDILRRAELVDNKKVEKALAWLNENLGSIQYDNDKLTEESLKMQIRTYYATKELIEEKKFNFVGVKCHYDLSEYYVTQCLSAAFINDPYDWDGAKDPVVFSCEADADAALTMQVMHLVSNQPVIFADFRHYDKNENIFTFCNCGAMSTWYAERSDDPKKNLKSVNLSPVIPKYGGKGCHVQYIAKEGEMTFGRLSRVLDNYKLTIFKGEFKKYPPEKLNETCPAWPHGYVKVDVDYLDLINRYESNHVHGIYGDYIEELTRFCELSNIEYEVIG
uniref:L-fucose/L-arabinose isomerase family protein n=1 Tax=Lutispora sp. TaxID=2828727 RepID=UPI00356A1CCE